MEEDSQDHPCKRWGQVVQQPEQKLLPQVLPAGSHLSSGLALSGHTPSLVLNVGNKLPRAQGASTGG